MRHYSYKLLQIILIAAFALSMTKTGMVFADDGSTGTPEPQSVVEVTEVSTDTAAPTGDPTAEATVGLETAVPQTEATDLSAVVAALAEADASVVDESGDTQPMTTIETQEALAGADPWFVDATDSGHVIAYFSTQDECDAWVLPAGYITYTCFVDNTPIQAAVDDDRSDGGTIYLSGSFSEAVKISKNVTLDGGGETVISAPIEALADNGNATVKGLIYVDGTNAEGNLNVTLKGLTLSGSGLTNSLGMDAFTLAGILVENANVALLDNTIVDFLSSDLVTATGIVLIDSNVEMSGNTLSNNSIGLVVDETSSAAGEDNTFNQNGVRVMVQSGGYSDLNIDSVYTDQGDYNPGSTVTFGGDNADNAGYLPGETVRVDVTGPNGYTATCSAVVDEFATWTCQVTLWGDERAYGDYAYTATSLTSNVVKTGAFSDGVSVTGATLNGVASVIVAASTTTTGTSITAVVTVTIAQAGNWKGTRWTVGTATGCINNTDRTGPGTYTASMTIRAPAAAGVYNVVFTPYTNNTCTTGAGTAYTMTGAVTVKDRTTTALVCNPSTTGAGYSSVCTATVTRSTGSSIPSGNVNFTSSVATGAFSSTSCTLSGSGATASCSVTYTPSASGNRTITAAFDGGTGFLSSSRAVTLTVNTKANTVVTFTCTPDDHLVIGNRTRCTATVTRLGGTNSLTGTLTFTHTGTGTFDITTCSLNSGPYSSTTCSVNYTPSAADTGIHVLTVKYGGSTYYNASTSSTSVGVTDTSATTTSLDCTPASTSIETTTSCTVTVSNIYSATSPTGSVNFTTSGSGSLSASSCVLGNPKWRSASCQVDYTPTAGIGVHTLTANYPAVTGFAASQDTFDLTATALTPTLAFGATPTPTYLGGNFFVSASSGDSEGDITYSIDSGPCAIVNADSGELSSSGGGTCVVRASIAAWGDYTTTSVTKNVTIGIADPQLAFDASPAVTYGDASFTVSASSRTGYAITYSQVSGPCAWSTEAAFTPTGAGDCVVQASTPATADFLAASVQQTVTIDRRAVTISADSFVKREGAADPVLTYVITNGSLVDESHLTGALARTAGEAIGVYPIMQGSLALNADYDLTFTGAILRIIFDPNTDTDNDGVIDLQDNCPEVANADQLDSDRDTRGNVCDASPYAKTNTLPVPITGAEPVVLSCEVDTVLELSNNTFVTVPPMFCGMKGILTSKEEITLPAGLPEGVFQNVFTFRILNGETLVDPLPVDAHVKYALNLPEELLDADLVVYYWDDNADEGKGAWVALPAYSEQAGSPVESLLYPSDTTDTRTIFSGVRLNNEHYLEFETNFSGLFLVVMK